MARKKKNAFRGKVHRSMEKKGSKFGYLNLPGGLPVFKAEGKTEVVFDIIPYVVTDEHHLDADVDEDVATPGNLWWKKPIKVHRDVGTDDEMIICPTTIGKKCPICEHFKTRKEEGADWEDELKHIAPKNRSLFIIVPVDTRECEEKYEAGIPHLFDMSDHLFLKALREETDRDIDNDGFPDLEDGMSLSVRFAEDKFGKNKFAKTSRIDFVEREEQYTEDILEDVPALDDILKVFSYKEIEEKFHGAEDLADVDEDEDELVDEDEVDERPARKPKSARRTTRKPKDEEPEDEDEDEPEEKPTRQRRTSKEKCPHGHKFGVDANDEAACEECTLWDDCMEAKEKNE